MKWLADQVHSKMSGEKKKQQMPQKKLTRNILFKTENVASKKFVAKEIQHE